MDIHDVQMCNKPLDQEPPTIRFGDGSETRNRSVRTPPGQLWSGRIGGIVLAYTPGESKAYAFVSLGSLPETDNMYPGQASLLLSERVPDSLPIRFQLTQLASSKSTSSSTNRASIIINVPLVNVVLEKLVFDGLQIWADSVTQAIEQLTDADGTDTEIAQSRNPSLIGSRFFAKSRRVGSRGSDESSFGTKASTPKQSETAVKVIIAEGRVDFNSFIAKLIYSTCSFNQNLNISFPNFLAFNSSF